MVKSWVRGHRWSRGKDNRHPGYYRKKRSKSKKRMLVKPSPRLYAVKDEYGQFQGYSTK